MRPIDLAKGYRTSPTQIYVYLQLDAAERVSIMLLVNKEYVEHEGIPWMLRNVYTLPLESHGGEWWGVLVFKSMGLCDL